LSELIFWVAESVRDGRLDGCNGLYSSLHFAMVAAHEHCLVPKLLLTPEQNDGKLPLYGWEDCYWVPEPIDDILDASMVQWKLYQRNTNEWVASVRPYKVDEYLPTDWTDYK
jgi:hypothetical protein